MKRLVLATILLACLLSTPALAHGNRYTPDNLSTDAGHSIDYYPATSIQGHGGFFTSVRYWNAVDPGPDFHATSSLAAADGKFDVIGPSMCYWSGTPVGGYMIYWNGDAQICVSTRYSEWTIKMIADHELGHAEGMVHHFDATSTVMSYTGHHPDYLSRHDKRWKKGYADFWAGSAMPPPDPEYKVVFISVIDVGGVPVLFTDHHQGEAEGGEHG